MKAYDLSLRHIEELSKNSRSAWFALVGVLLFSVLAVAGVQDRDFFASGVETRLPLIGVSVPTVPFFWAAPTIILALYVHLHLYLLRLWSALSHLPVEVEVEEATVRSEDMVYPWLISDAVLSLKSSVHRQFMSVPKLAIAVSFVWIAGPLVLALFWVRSWPYHSEWLSMFAAINMLVAIWLGTTTLFFMLNQVANTSPLPTVLRFFSNSLHGIKVTIFTIIISVLVSVISWNKTEGPLFGLEIWALYSADLYQTELVERPDNWVPHEEAELQFLARYGDIRRAELDELLLAEKSGKKLPDGRSVEWLTRARTAFKKERIAFLRSLNKLDLSFADLRRANLEGAFLPGVELKGARLGGAYLGDANLEGAKFVATDFSGAKCNFLFNISPLGLRTQGFIGDDGDITDCTSFWRTDLSGAIFKNIEATGINASKARLVGATFSNVDLSNSRLSRADLSRADMIQVYFENADLTGSIFAGSSVRSGWSGGEADEFPTDLTDANLQLADFSNSVIINVKANGADFTGVNFSGANVLEAGLSADQIANSSGDRRTVMPMFDPSVELPECFQFSKEDFRSLAVWLGDLNANLTERFNLC
ncbi:pentapeptide repeat-containing protein [Roseobacter sp. EG26]|uniref:pentapeptide repeat-containing protein n=1 Tax=Roseobacter sp. EG26 TaxID=3412477 RepID=UPI003CE44EF6